MEEVVIKLDQATAMVLFDCLARWDYDARPFELRDEAERYAMLKVMAGLESSLVAPFQSDYAEQLAHA